MTADTGTRDFHVILVTGATRGIGRAVVRRLARQGHAVIAAHRSPDVGRSGEDRAHDIQLDVTDAASIVRATEGIQGRFGRLDGIINNAAVFVPTRALEADRAAFDAMMQTNVFGAWSVIAAALPLLGRSRRAKIVNVSSSTASLGLTAGGVPLPGEAHRRAGYCASKAALNMMSIHIAQALHADRDTRHVGVSVVSPGFTATRMNGFNQDGASTEYAARTVCAEYFTRRGPGHCHFSGPEGDLPW